MYALSFAPVEEYRFLGFDLKGVPFASKPVQPAFVPPPVPTVFTAAPQPVFSDTSSNDTSSNESYDLTALLTGADGLPVSAPTLSPVRTGTGQPLLVDYGNSMRFFYQSIADHLQSDRGPEAIRIAYVGDSQIEGDVITKDLRAMLQGRFGGAGTGFMKIIAEDAGFRTDMRHMFSDDWKVEALNRDNAENKFWFGPVFISGKGSWVTYQIPGKGLAGIDCYLMYWGDGGRRRITISVNKGPEAILGLDPAMGIHFLKIYDHGGQALKNITITFPDAGTRAYGVSFQGGAGVYVDNYSLRGHSGLELARVSSEIAEQVRRSSLYKLIILQFGVNVFYPPGEFKLYEKGISRVIGHMRDLFPDAGIIVVSTTDRCVKDGDQMKSDPCVEELLKAQRRAAEKEGVAFFDLYHGMGGTGAMTEWVRDGYAFKDYLHINRRGGRKIATLLYETLMGRETLMGKETLISRRVQ